jgi:hypothetical protein
MKADFDHLEAYRGTIAKKKVEVEKRRVALEKPPKAQAR